MRINTRYIIFCAEIIEKHIRLDLVNEMQVELNSKVVICFNTDDNYSVYTYIAMHSIMMNCNISIMYAFYILVPPNFQDNNREMLREIEKLFENCKVKIIEVKLEIENDPLFGRITSVAYYRLFAPILIPEDKCLYLDQDIVALNDVSEIFKINVSDFFAAGVRSIMATQRINSLTDFFESYTDKCSLNQVGRDIFGMHPWKAEQLINRMNGLYINAGVMLMNLKKIRKMKNWEENVVSLVNAKLPLGDSDVINILCSGKIREISEKYNCNSSGCIKDKPVLVHYSGIRKPWNYIATNYAKEWWEACSKTRFYRKLKSDIICMNKIYTEKKQRSMSKDGVIEYCKNKDVLIYGAGKVGKRMVQEFIRLGKRPYGIAVSNEKDNPLEVCEVEVRKIDYFVNLNDKVVVLLAVSVDVENILRNLDALGFKDIIMAGHLF